MSVSVSIQCGFCFSLFFFFKQKTAYEMRISDWSSDVCSSDLLLALIRRQEVVDQIATRLVRSEVGHALCDRADEAFDAHVDALTAAEIGRASCRERVCQYV